MPHPAPEIAKSTWIYSAFEWDPKDADPVQLFSTEPPPGFAVEDHTNDPVARSSNTKGTKSDSPPVEKQPDSPPVEKQPDSPESAAVLKRLERKVAMQFPNRIPLEEVLKYVRAATRGPNDAGIPFAFDDAGMKRAGQSLKSLVSIDVEDEPLKQSLGELLKPLGLWYEVRKGVLTITSYPRSPIKARNPDGIRIPVECTHAYSSASSASRRVT